MTRNAVAIRATSSVDTNVSATLIVISTEAVRLPVADNPSKYPVTDGHSLKVTTFPAAARIDQACPATGVPSNSGVIVNDLFDADVLRMSKVASTTASYVVQSVGMGTVADTVCVSAPGEKVWMVVSRARPWAIGQVRAWITLAAVDQNIWSAADAFAGAVSRRLSRTWAFIWAAVTTSAVTQVLGAVHAMRGVLLFQ